MRLVGDCECAALDALIAGARRGGAALVLRGEPGVGRTALLADNRAPLLFVSGSEEHIMVLDRAVRNAR